MSAEHLQDNLEAAGILVPRNGQDKIKMQA